MKVSNRSTVGQTVTRGGIVRSVDRGNSFWRFSTSMPEGLPWSVHREAINGVETLNRYTTDTVDFTNSGFSWMFPYRGDEPNINNLTVSYIASGNQLVVQSGVTITSGYIFKKGDIIQLVGGRVYEITNNVAWDDTAITVHRPIVDESIDTYSIRVGPAAQHTIRCINMPEWSFVSRDQVSWDGSFVFQEEMI
jgi:signal peptidase I